MVVKMLLDGDQNFWITNKSFKQLVIEKIQSPISWLYSWWRKVTKSFGRHMPNGDQIVLVIFGCNLRLIV